MRRVLLACAISLAFAVPSFAQTTPVKNPSAIVFDSPDHAQLVASGGSYEIDIVPVKGTGVLQTLTVAATAVTAVSTTVTAKVNVQPVGWGEYTSRVRLVAGTVRSEDSPASDPWQRAPGAPSKPALK